MAATRKRFIAPGLFQNEALGALGLRPFMLAAFLPAVADREGRLEDRPAQIGARLFPYDHDGERPSVVMISEWLDDLTRAGYIRRYAVDGVPLIHIVNFVKHQHPHPDEARSKLPPPPSPNPIKSHEISSDPIASNEIALNPNESLPEPSEPSIFKSKSSRALAGESNEIPLDSPPNAPATTATEKTATAEHKVNGHAQTPKEPRPSVDDVVDLWHELMPDCARVRVLTAARRTAIAQRIRQDLPTANHWRRYFKYIRTVPFLMGKAPPGNGHSRAFRPTLAWFCKADNYAKVSEDFYDAGL